jgi:hypothetical protein
MLFRTSVFTHRKGSNFLIVINGLEHCKIHVGNPFAEKEWATAGIIVLRQYFVVAEYKIIFILRCRCSPIRNPFNLRLWSVLPIPRQNANSLSSQCIYPIRHRLGTYRDLFGRHSHLSLGTGNAMSVYAKICK